MTLSQQLILCVVLIYTIGLIMIFGASSAEILDISSSRSIHQACLKQLLYGGAGLILGTLLFLVGYERLLQRMPQLFIFFSLLLVLVFVPGIGIAANGSRRWIHFLHISLQPSEFVKYIVPFYYIFLFEKKKERLFLRKTFFKNIAILGMPLFLILIEPNNGTVGVIAMTLLVLFFLTEIPAKLWALPVLGLVLLGATFALSLPYVRGRIDVYLHPEKDLRGKGHQPHQAKIASGSGGLFGKGLGKSFQKLSYLPEAQNDYIAAIFAEEFGFFGMCCFIGIYMWMSLIGWMVALQAQERVAFLMTSTIVFLISFQVFLNLGVVSGLLPSTGLNLPFFSQGGSSLIANCGAMGLLMQIAQKKVSGIRE